ncbi:MAG: hypothetical protein MPJ50_19160, partial [Pirellulales bacterium]|nr:hypothetical protein [Pirellulales bacterium]
MKEQQVPSGMPDTAARVRDWASRVVVLSAPQESISDQPEVVTDLLNRLTTLRRTQKFPEAASRRMALSSSASASNRFSR